MRTFAKATMLFSLSLLTNCAMPAETDEPVVIDEQIEEASQEVTQADKDWWKGLTQLERNWEITFRAFTDLNKNVGEDCKNWARTVVKDASHGVVSIPSTSPNASGYAWYSSAYVQKLASINSATPGDLVQMNYSSGPHTAIVYWRGANDVCFIDSNYYMITKPNTVTARCQTISSFLNSVTIGGVQKYNVYRIIGG